jgi:type IV pilus assembly protein PilM
MIGIDIGSVTLKAVELSPGRDGFRLDAVAVVPTPADTIAQGVIYEPDQVGAALGELLKGGGFKARKAVISVGGQTSLAVRVIELPKMKDDELRRAITLDLDRQIPFPAQGTVHDFCKIQPADAPPDETTQEVLLAVAQEELVNGHLGALRKAGVQPTAIDIECLALTRALVNAAGNGYGRGTVALVNIGASLTEISIVHDGLLRFVRSLALGGDSFTTAIGQGFIVESSEAEDIKRRWGTLLLDEPVGPAPPPSPPRAMPQPAGPSAMRDEEEGITSRAVDLDLDLEEGLPGMEARGAGRLQPEAHVAEGAPSEQAEAAPAGPAGVMEGADDEERRRMVSQALMSVVTDLAREIRSTLDYFSTRKGMEVQRIILCGGSAKVENLAQFMSRELNVETVLGSPFQRCTPASPAMEAQYLADIAPMMGVATGLAMRDMLG